MNHSIGFQLLIVYLVSFIMINMTSSILSPKPRTNVCKPVLILYLLWSYGYKIETETVVPVIKHIVSNVYDVNYINIAINMYYYVFLCFNTTIPNNKQLANCNSLLDLYFSAYCLQTNLSGYFPEPEPRKILAVSHIF